MESPSAGDVVLVPFPFSDLSQFKLRPAIVLTVIQRGDCILCQVTSNAYGDPSAVQITDEDFSTSSLRIVSYARPGKVFTAHHQLIARQVGTLRRETLLKVIEALVSLLRSSLNGKKLE